MGRFYKTASPQMVDFMYKIPEQALLKAIEGVDKQIENEELYRTETSKLLQEKALAPDLQRQKEKLEGYQKEIDEVASLYNTSSLGALKDKDRIRALRNKIYQDVTRGEIAAQYKNYDIRQKHLEEETKRATDKDGTVREEDLAIAMKKFDEAFAKGDVDDQGNIVKPGGTAYDPTTKAYRTYAPEKLVDYFDVSEEAKVQSEGWVSDIDEKITKQYLDPSGNYLITDTQGKEILPKDNLTFGLYNILTSNPKVTNQRNQMIKIKSGAKPGTEEYLKEWESVYGVRQQRGNLSSPFAMETVMQTVTDPETGKTETKPLTRKVQKYDENGNPVKGEFEEKEVKRMVNPGEIYSIAQAAAERKDKNKIESSVTRQATPEYEKFLQQQKEIAVAEAIADDKEKREAKASVQFSNNQAEITESVITATDSYEAEKNIEKLKDNAISLVNNAKKNYVQLIKDKKLSPNVEKEILTELYEIKSTDFKSLQALFEKHKAHGLAGVGTGVKELEAQYNKSMNEYEKQDKHYSIISKANKPSTYDDINAKYKEAEAKLQELKDQGLDYNNNLWKEASNEFNKIKNQRSALITQWRKGINNSLDVNNKETMNANTRSVYAMGGSEIEKLSGKKVFTGYVNALKNIKASNLFPHLLSGSNAVVVEKGGKSKATNFTELIKDLKINHEVVNAMDSGEKVEVEGKKTVTFEMGSARVVPDELIVPLVQNGKKINKNLGENSIQVTMKVYDKTTGKTTVNEIYIPANEIYNTDLKKGNDDFAKFYKPNKFKNRTNSDFGNIKSKAKTEDKEDYFQTTEEGHKYYPNSDSWIFNNGYSATGSDALDYYRNLLGIN